MSTWIVTAGRTPVPPLVAFVRPWDAAPTVVVVGTESDAGAAARAGVARVLWVPLAPDAPAEAYASEVADLLAAEASGSPIIVGSTGDADRVLLGAISARLGATLISKSIAVEVGDDVRLTHAVAGGIAHRSITSNGPVAIVTDGTPADELGAHPEAPIERREGVPSLTILDSAPHAEPPIDLTAARRIVAVGRGVADKTMLAEAAALAAALDAEVACSRPLSDALGWLPHDRCVGLTGRQVAPELYLAVGISGQLQHIVGARGAGIVVVVNDDPSAPYFGEADYGVVGDLAHVVPALRRALA